MALGVCFLLFVLGLILYEIRESYEDFLLLARGTPSFAYVTHVSPNWASKNGSRTDRCRLEALLPHQTLSHEPDQLPDMGDARYFNSYEPDGDRNCRQYLNTWQPVLFDPNDRSRARFTWGLKTSFAQFAGLAILAAVLAVVVSIVRAIKRWRARRHAR